MPGVGVACGSNVGECRSGLSTCSGGKIVCNAVGPTAEICDGKDNDCNGSIDDGVLPPGDSCNPASLGAGQPLVGECRPGIFACRGARGGSARAGWGRPPRSATARTTTATAVIDNNASCAPGYVCIHGECVQTCDESGENPRLCPADRHCTDGACLVKACARQPCPAGQVCQADGTCIDPCSLVTCPAGAICRNGVCVDCYSQGCQPGLRCIGRQCIVDPCEGKSCGTGQFCQAGVCVPSCAGVACAAGEVCVQGKCVTSACPVLCPGDYFCDPATGACRPKLCAAMPCLAGQVCVSSTGRCESDPCEQVHCGVGEFCVVKDDGSPDCAVPQVSGIPRTAKAEGGGLLSCSVATGGAGRGVSGSAVLVVVGLALLLAWRRRLS